MPSKPVVLDSADLPVERFADPAFGTVRWHTLFSADRTPTEAMNCGVALLAEGEHLALHRHAPPEIYFGVEGTARVVVDGVSHALRPGVAVFIPGNAIHGVFADEGPARFFYVFAGDSFHEVEYHLLPEAAFASTAPEAIAAGEAVDTALLEALDGLTVTGDEGPLPN